MKKLASLLTINGLVPTYAPIPSLCFSHAFELGTFPSIFKIAKVVPTFKSGNKQIVNNYRPTSLLPTSSKILEKLIKTRLIEFFDTYQLSSALRISVWISKKHIVIHALVDVNLFALDAIQRKQQTALLLMDVRKAFDPVSHNILLQKSYHYGIRGTAHKLLEIYFSFRNQFVSVPNHHSSLKAINIGVPQGSRLRLLLFFTYIYDNSNSVSCNPRIFADDTCLLVSSPSLTGLKNECNKEINKLQTWISANELQINPEKSAIIVIPSNLTA